MNWSNEWSTTPAVWPIEIETRRILIVNEDKQVFTVEAEVVGDLGVYKAIHPDIGWRVAHLPTLTRIDKAIPEGLHTKKALLNWCRKVQEACEYEFNVLREYNNDNYENIEVINLDELMHKCLAIKVE